MTTTAVSKYDDVIDVRDIIARVEELEGELQERHEAGAFASDFDDWVANARDNSDPIYAAFGDDGAQVQSDIEEFYNLSAFLEELKGYGGDEQWRGDWYPVTLIRDSYFTDYARELVSDIGDMPREIPSYIEIDWDATARNIQGDYASVEFDGETYWYR